jgi:hypothetical protein
MPWPITWTSRCGRLLTFDHHFLFLNEEERAYTIFQVKEKGTINKLCPSHDMFRNCTNWSCFSLTKELLFCNEEDEEKFRAKIRFHPDSLVIDVDDKEWEVKGANE